MTRPAGSLTIVSLPARPASALSNCSSRPDKPVAVASRRSRAPARPPIPADSCGAPRDRSRSRAASGAAARPPARGPPGARRRRSRASGRRGCGAAGSASSAERRARTAARRDAGCAICIGFGVDGRRLLAERELEAAAVEDRPAAGRDRDGLAVLRAPSADSDSARTPCSHAARKSSPAKARTKSREEQPDPPVDEAVHRRRLLREFDVGRLVGRRRHAARAASRASFWIRGAEAALDSCDESCAFWARSSARSRPSLSSFMFSRSTATLSRDDPGEQGGDDRDPQDAARDAALGRLTTRGRGVAERQRFARPWRRPSAAIVRP